MASHPAFEATAFWRGRPHVSGGGVYVGQRAMTDAGRLWVRPIKVDLGWLVRWSGRAVRRWETGRTRQEPQRRRPRGGPPGEAWFGQPTVAGQV